MSLASWLQHEARYSLHASKTEARDSFGHGLNTVILRVDVCETQHPERMTKPHLHVSESLGGWLQAIINCTKNTWSMEIGFPAFMAIPWNTIKQDHCSTVACSSKKQKLYPYKY